VLEAVFILLEPLSRSRRILIGSHSLPPPSLVHRFGPSESSRESLGVPDDSLQSSGIVLISFLCLDSSTIQVIFLSYFSSQLHSAFTFL
jgi:hypothetical protein